MDIINKYTESFYKKWNKFWVNKSVWLLVCKDISELDDYTSLSALFIQDYKYPIIDLTKYTCLTNLVHLYLNNNNLIKVPDLCHLLNLEVVDISNNRVKHLNIFNLKRLNKLYAQNNAINSIDTLAGLVNLKFIDLSYNQISYINDVFSDCVNLKAVNLTGNKLASVPDIEGIVYLNENPLILDTVPNKRYVIDDDVLKSYLHKHLNIDIVDPELLMLFGLMHKTFVGRAITSDQVVLITRDISICPLLFYWFNVNYIICIDNTCFLKTRNSTKLYDNLNDCLSDIQISSINESKDLQVDGLNISKLLRNKEYKGDCIVDNVRFDYNNSHLKLNGVSIHFETI